MILFVVLSAMLVLAALIFIAGPLLSRRGGLVDREAVDAVAITRQQQLADLERELEDGEIDNRTYELSRREIEGEASVRQAKVESGEARKTGKPITAIVLGLLIPLFTIFIYQHVGTPEAIEGPATADLSEMDMDQAVRALEERLEAMPDDLEGWVMLGRTRVALGQYDKAVDAYREAVDIAGEDNPRVLADYAEAITLANPEQMVTHAAPLFRHVLEIDPEQSKGLWYGGLIAFEEGDYEQAEVYWERLLSQDPPDGFRRVLEDRLAAAQAAQQGGETQADAGNGAVSVQLNVAVHETLQNELNESDVVFVIARAADSPNSPPLAGIRLPLSALPGQFRLGDENAMLDGHRISDHERIEIIARVSRSGEATPQAGDLEGRAVIDVAAHREEAADIVIDEVID